MLFLSGRGQAGEQGSLEDWDVAGGQVAKKGAIALGLGTEQDNMLEGHRLG